MPLRTYISLNSGWNTNPTGVPAAIAFRSVQCVGVCGIILSNRRMSAQTLVSNPTYTATYTAATTNSPPVNRIDRPSTPLRKKSARVAKASSTYAGIW
jgi:hypothetical protein